MFLRLLTESFRRQKRRKALAAAAILLGTTAVTAMLALATTIGDRIHSELAVYGANIIVTPKVDALDVNIGGQNLKPATGNTYLHERDLTKLQTIFWHNNITAISPELDLGSGGNIFREEAGPRIPVNTLAVWFNNPAPPEIVSSLSHGAQDGVFALHPWWKIQGQTPEDVIKKFGYYQVLVGARLAKRLKLAVGDKFGYEPTKEMELYSPPGIIYEVTGVLRSGDQTEEQLLLPLMGFLDSNSVGAGNDLKLSRIEIAARTRPEDAFARQNPDSLSPHQRDLWYCRPYANSIAYQIQEAIPNSTAQQVRKVEQSEGTVLSRISGLMWLISAAALLAAGFAVSAAMATAVLERRAEIALMRSLGAARATVAALFYTESTLLAIAAGTAGFLLGSLLAYTLGRAIFPGEPTPLFTPILLPAILALAITVAILGSTPAIRSALNANPTSTLRGAD